MKKILVIEDDEILNSGLCYNIEKIELYPVPAYCINDAKQKLKEDTFDLILLDVQLMEMVLTLQKKQCPKMALLLFS